MSSKKLVAILIKGGISAALIWFVVREIDVESLGQKLATAAPMVLMAGGIVLLLQMMGCVVRWRIALSAIGGDVQLRKLFQFYYIGLFFNQFLPSTVGGDAFRIYKAYRAGLDIRRSVNGVILDRIATLFSLALVGFCFSPLLLGRVEYAHWVVLAMFGVFIAALAGLIFLAVLHKLPIFLYRWRFFRMLEVLSYDVRSTFLNPKVAVPLMVWSVATHMLLVVYTSFLAMSLDLGIPLLDFFILIPIVLLAMAIPISIAGWGVREGAMVAAFGMTGVPNGDALALSILFGVFVAAISLPGGVVLLFSNDKHIENLEEQAFEDEEDVS